MLKAAMRLAAELLPDYRELLLGPDPDRGSRSTKRGRGAALVSEPGRNCGVHFRPPVTRKQRPRWSRTCHQRRADPPAAPPWRAPRLSMPVLRSWQAAHPQFSRFDGLERYRQSDLGAGQRRPPSQLCSATAELGTWLSDDRGWWAGRVRLRRHRTVPLAPAAAHAFKQSARR